MIILDITDPNNITRSHTNVSGIGSERTAMWTDVNGYLYAGNNNGDIYLIENPMDPSPTATLLLSTPNTTVNDGISCASSSPFEELLDQVLDNDNDGIVDADDHRR